MKEIKKIIVLNFELSEVHKIEIEIEEGQELEEEIQKIYPFSLSNCEWMETPRGITKTFTNQFIK